MPHPFEPRHTARSSHSVGVIHRTRIVVQRSCCFSRGRKILNLMVYITSGTFLGIFCGDDLMSSWFVAMSVLFGVGALTLHRCAVQRLLTWIAFSSFVVDPVLRACGGGHLWLR